MAIPYELYTVMMIYFNIGMKLRFSEYVSEVVGKNAIKMNFMEIERYMRTFVEFNDAFVGCFVVWKLAVCLLQIISIHSNEHHQKMHYIQK